MFPVRNHRGCKTCFGNTTMCNLCVGFVYLLIPYCHTCITLIIYTYHLFISKSEFKYNKRRYLLYIYHEILLHWTVECVIYKIHSIVKMLNELNEMKWITLNYFNNLIYSCPPASSWRPWLRQGVALSVYTLINI